MAERWLVSRRRKVNDAVMFDIDDTLIRSSNDTAISHIVNLLFTSRLIGYKIVIITARRPESRFYTEVQLAAHGIFPDVLEFCTPEQKTQMKNNLSVTHGYNFVLSVGDMPTDLGGSEKSLLIT